MSKHRLSFPFSFLVQPLRVSPPRLGRQDTARLSRPLYSAGFSTSSRNRAPETVSQRYGTANEPPPHFDSSKKSPPKAPATKQKAIPSPAATEEPRIDPPPKDATAEEKVNAGTETSEQPEKEVVHDGEFADQQAKAAKDQQSSATPATAGKSDSNSNKEVQYSSSQNALNTIMGMDPPLSDDSAVAKPPHLQAPRYVHHFDTFSIVKDLHEGGFAEEEAETLMKAMRAVLADNMELARDGLVSKSDEEMSVYLFRAACSELRTEIRNNRSALTEQMRTQRTSLQHEVDILSQRITAETANLKDELKGMFDDRKMAVRMERRDVENKIQEVNYNITTRLNSEMKSEVEGLRWVLVRRTAMALVIVAVTALLTLQIAKQGEKRKESGEGGSGKRGGPNTVDGTDSASGQAGKTNASAGGSEFVSLG